MPLTASKLAVVAAALAADVRVAAAAAQQAGFGGLQFEAISPALDFPKLSASGRREFLHLLGSRNLRLVGLRVDLGPKGFAPGADVDQLLARLERVMESAAGLAAPLLCCDLGPLPEPPPVEKPKAPITPQQAGLILLPTFAAAPAPEIAAAPVPAPLDPVFAATVDGALAELGTRADRYSVSIAFRSELASFAAIDRALAAARCPWFGIDLDPRAMLADAWDDDEIFSRLGPLIRHMRARDAVAGADRRTKPAAIGQGSVQWPKLLNDLDAAGYHGWITVDSMEQPDRAAAARAALEFLHPPQRT